MASFYHHNACAVSNLNLGLSLVLSFPTPFSLLEQLPWRISRPVTKADNKLRELTLDIIAMEILGMSSDRDLKSICAFVCEEVDEAIWVTLFS
uniref:Uncharacterized protein n=1 Tax=Kalanchoe fedtschenkoi TaxID=63787 RepID=A0A7N0VGQ8_KALFE